MTVLNETSDQLLLRKWIKYLSGDNFVGFIKTSKEDIFGGNISIVLFLVNQNKS